MDEWLIEAQELTKFYGEGRGTVQALKGASLNMNRGEFIAIMGPSGSGKSTFMHLLGCLNRPTSGSYKLAGNEVSGLSRDELARIRSRQIGFVFQNFNLLSRTSAQENVELPMMYMGVRPAERARRARLLLDQVGLSTRVSHRPNELSGGEQQRVAIARALANGAPLILGDEPTGNLDSKSSIDIMTLFRRLNRDQGITMIVVTHSMEVAAWFNRIISFHDGLITFDKPAEEVIPKKLRKEVEALDKNPEVSK
jgi:putative ABC transport system ATP-binding protein